MLVIFLIELIGLSAFPQSQNTINTYNSLDTIIDNRDNQSYKIAKIGNQYWFAENLNFNIENSFKPENMEVGRLYSYEQAMIACPDGFHLPSDQDWLQLERFLGIFEPVLFDEDGDINRGNVAHKIKVYKYSLEPQNDFEYNTTLFSAIPSGIYVRRDHNHQHTTVFWTSTEKDLLSAFLRALYPHTNGIGRTANPKEFGFAVRCVKDTLR